MNSKNGAEELTQSIIHLIKEKKPRSVKELVSLAKGQLNITEQELYKILVEIQNKNIIKLERNTLPKLTNLSTYLKSKQALRYWLTTAITIFSAIVVFIIPDNFYPLAYIRAVLSLILILWLPGYTFLNVFFPYNFATKNSTNPLQLVERVSLSIGLSIVIVSLIVLLLNFTSFGINLTPIVLSLMLFILIFVTVGVIREFKVKNQT